MGFRDRFFTPVTAKALLSWRIAVAIGVGVALGVAGLPIGAAIGVAAGVYAVTVLAAMPGGAKRPNIDPFVLSEPWRQLIQQAQGAGRKLRRTVDGFDDGPLKQQLAAVVEQLDHGLDEAWQIAQRGDEIDEMVRQLDPTRLRSRLGTLEAQAAASPSADTTAAITSVEKQLATAERLKQQSAETADSLRRTQVQLDELVARAAEVRLGVTDTDLYARDVDELVIKLEALHQAVQETRTA